VWRNNWKPEASIPTAARAAKNACLDFITKPFDMQDVRLRIANLLETSELQWALRQQNVVLASTLRDQTVELEEARIESVEQLALVAELRDDVTGQHNARVARMSCAIAEAIGPRSGSGQLLGRVAALHDIGKIGIPDCILLKTGPLSPSEWTTMKTHTTIGARILSSGRSEFMHLAKEIARSHHERWDGTGYPDGLKGTRIPLAARIVSIADVFDALSSDRPYRSAYTVEDSCRAIEQGSHTMFDPSLVKVFRTLVPDYNRQQDSPSGRAVSSARYHRLQLTA
jgi:putative two-component system response regulator